MDEAIQGLNAINGWAGEFNATAGNLAEYIAAAILTVSLVFVVYSISTKHSNASTYFIAWLVALLFTMLFILK